MTTLQGNAVNNGPRNILIAELRSTTPPSPFFLVILLLLNLLWNPASAEPPFTPIPARRAEYTSSNLNKTLFIRGGLNGTTVIPQFYSLDLTPLLFHSSNLPWKYRYPGGEFLNFSAKMPLAVIQKGETLLYFGAERNMTEYDLVYENWYPGSMFTCNNTAGARATDLVKSFDTALVDPKTDLVYIPYGYGGGNEMLVYQHDTVMTRPCSGAPMPPTSIGNNYAWSDSKNAMYMLGDTVPAKGPTMWEFLPTTKAWQEIPKKGTPPTALWANSCMVSAIDGLKLLVFGGDNSVKANGDMFIFDTANYTWTKAATSPSPRTEMACTSAGEYFVTWGGTDLSLTATNPTPMLFYNIMNDKWLKQEANSTFSDAVYPSASTNTEGSGSVNTGLPSAEELTSKNKGAVVGGGVAAGVVAIAAIIGFLLYRRRTKQARVKRDPQDLKRSSLTRSDDSDGHDSSEEHIDRKLAPHTLRDWASLGLDQHSKKLKAEILAAAGEGGREAIVSVHGQQGPQYHPPSPQYFCVGRDQDQPWHLQQRQPQNSQSPYLERAHRNPHVQHNNAPTNPLEQIALIEAKYDQDREQLRQKQLAALERVRRQWQDDMAASTLREAASNETRQ
ncbi:hypothetical protein F5H01DRAFT_53338 [Linnemannia elongata]|nr:hypothetical protein F5H01DRAFT_53338 [Linnemannia elongata]